MDRTDLQRLSKDELIELLIQLQRPDKTSRTSSKPPSTDKKEKRENSRPGGAKPGHEPRNRRLADNPDCREPSWRENMELRSKKAIEWGLPHFPCYPVHLVTEDALGTRICWPRWSDNAAFNRYWRPSACFRQAARKVRQTLVHGEEDDVIPISSARRLFALANEPKTFVSVPGGGHLVLERADVFPRMCEWIDEKILVSRS